MIFTIHFLSIVEPSEPSYRRTEQGTIQHGGFCVVVKAWDDTKQKALAIKILNSMITNVDAWRPYLVDLRSMQPVLHEQPYLQHWHEAQAHKADETTTTWPWARPPMGCQRPALGHPPRWSASARPWALHPDGLPAPGPGPSTPMVCQRPAPGPAPLNTHPGCITLP